MDEPSFHILLKNYNDLLQRIDDHIRHIEKKYPEKLLCKKGCDTCCRPLSLFPVEAFALSAAFIRLPEDTRQIIVNQVKDKKETCPLLMDSACILYSHRPVICRTHGYPIYMEKDGETLIDFCPKNFNGMTTFPKDALLSIEQLNTTLAAINAHFLESIETDTPFTERIPISKALVLLEK